MPIITFQLDSETHSDQIVEINRILFGSDKPKTAPKRTKAKKPAPKSKSRSQTPVTPPGDLLDDTRIALKTFAKKHSRDEAKAIMQNHKVNSLTDLNTCAETTLRAILEEIPND